MRPSILIPTLQDIWLNTNLTTVLLGPPGIGKTQIVKQVIAQLGWKMFLSHPATDDPVDYKGMPFLDQVQQLARFFPIGVLRDVLECEEDCVWFIDDVGMAVTSVTSALVQIIDPYGRQLNDQKLGDNVRVVLASNRKQDRANSQTPIEPFKLRCTAVELTPSTDDWSDWASRNNIDPRIIAYINWRPDNLHDFEPSNDWKMSPTPRGYEFLNELLPRKFPNREARYEWYAGTVGPGVASEFLGFVEIFEQLPTRKEIEHDPANAPLPHLHMDRMYALTLYLANTTTPDNLQATVDYLERFPGELATIWSNLAPKYCPDITELGPFTQWCIKHAKDNQV